MHNSEEDELESPLGHTVWMFSYLTRELTVFRSHEKEEGENAQWHDSNWPMESVAFLLGVTPFASVAFDPAQN